MEQWNGGTWNAHYVLKTHFSLPSLRGSVATKQPREMRVLKMRLVNKCYCKHAVARLLRRTSSQ
jgi:hypothetical protein